MATNGHPSTKEQLDNALKLLDHELEHVALDQPLRIRAIGGYALMKHGVRSGDRAYTVDIDTVTKDYSAAVIQAVETVAQQANLDSDWLNNYNVMDNDVQQVEDMIDAKWLPQKTGLKNIDLSLASVPTLTRSKIIAADTAEFSGRTQDAPDLMDLLEHQNITSMSQFNTAYPDPYGEYPAVQEMVSGLFEQKQKQDRMSKLKKKVAARAALIEPSQEMDDGYTY